VNSLNTCSAGTRLDAGGVDGGQKRLGTQHAVEERVLLEDEPMRFDERPEQSGKSLARHRRGGLEDFHSRLAELAGEDRSVEKASYGLDRRAQVRVREPKRDAVVLELDLLSGRAVGGQRDRRRDCGERQAGSHERLDPTQGPTHHRHGASTVKVHRLLPEVTTAVSSPTAATT
jgi:hypothetical protein